jgi:hypothetical protein
MNDNIVINDTSDYDSNDSVEAESSADIIGGSKIPKSYIRISDNLKYENEYVIRLNRMLSQVDLISVLNTHDLNNYNRNMKELQKYLSNIILTLDKLEEANQLFKLGKNNNNQNRFIIRILKANKHFKRHHNKRTNK